MKTESYICDRDYRLLDLTALDNGAKCIGNLVQRSLGQLLSLDSRN